MRAIVWLVDMFKARRGPPPAGQLAFAFGAAVAAPNHPPRSAAPVPAAGGSTQQVAVRPHVRRTKAGLKFVHGHQAKRKKAIVVTRAPRKRAPFAWLDDLIAVLRPERDVHPATVEALDAWKRVWNAALAEPRKWLDHHLELQAPVHFKDDAELRRVITGSMKDNIARLVNGRLENDTDREEDEWGRPTEAATERRKALRIARQLQNSGEWAIKKEEAERRRWADVAVTPEQEREADRRRNREVADYTWKLANAKGIQDAFAVFRSTPALMDEYHKLEGEDLRLLVAYWPRIRVAMAIEALKAEGEAEGSYDTKKHLEEGWSARRFSSLSHIEADGIPTLGDGGSFDLELQQILMMDPEKGQAGHHWGEALPSNATARQVSGLGNNGTMRHKGEGMATVQLKMTPTDKLTALAYREYAQTRLRQMDAFFREKNARPRDEMFRGMTLPQTVIDALADGATPMIPLTGCTAFTFVESIADHYARSAWTNNQVVTAGGKQVACKLVVKRNRKVDDSIGFWNEPKEKEGKWGFEVLTTLTELKVKRYVPARDGEVATIYLETK